MVGAEASLIPLEIAPARELLPGWVVWGPLCLLVPGVFVLSFVVSWLGIALMAWPWRRSRALAWPERSRRAYSARVGAHLELLFLSLAPAVALPMFLGSLCPLPQALVIALLVVASLAGSGLAGYRLERSIREGRFPFSSWLAGVAVFWMLFAYWMPVLAVLVVLMPPTFEPLAWLYLGVAGALLCWLGMGGGFQLLRLMGLAYPARPRVRTVVEQTAARMQVPLAGVFEVAYPWANALALPGLRQVAFTPSAADLFDDEELAAVAAHELGHLTESRWALLGRLSPLLFILALGVVRPLLNTFGFWVSLIPFVLLLVVVFLTKALSRRLERRADALATASEAGEGVYARALLKLYEANLMPVVTVKNDTHPHLYDRALAAGVQPDFPRPRPPGRLLASVVVTFSFLAMFFLLVGVPFVLGHTRLAFREERHRLLVSLALSNGSARELQRYASWLGEHEEALTFTEAAAATDRNDPHYPANMAVLQALLGRCDDADRSARETERRAEAAGSMFDDLLFGDASQRKLDHQASVDRARNAVAWCRQQQQQKKR